MYETIKAFLEVIYIVIKGVADIGSCILQAALIIGSMWFLIQDQYQLSIAMSVLAIALRCFSFDELEK